MRRKVRISCKCARKVRIWGLRADFGEGGGGKKYQRLFRYLSDTIATALPRHCHGISTPARSDFSRGIGVGVGWLILGRARKRVARIAEMSVPYWKMTDFRVAWRGLVSLVGLAGWFAS